MAMDIWQNFRATTDNIAEREPSYAEAFPSAMRCRYGNVGIPAFRSGRGTEGQCLIIGWPGRARPSKANLEQGGEASLKALCMSIIDRSRK